MWIICAIFIVPATFTAVIWLIIDSAFATAGFLIISAFLTISDISVIPVIPRSFPFWILSLLNQPLQILAKLWSDC